MDMSKKSPSPDNQSTGAQKLALQIFVLSLLLTFGMFLGGKVLSGDTWMLLEVGKKSLTLSLAATIVFLMVYTLWKTQRSQPSASVQTKAEILELPEPPREVFDRLCEKMLERGWRLLQADAEQGLLRFRTRITSDSWGEYIKIKITAHGQHNSKVVVTSEPLLHTKVSDTLRAQEHVKWLKKLMKAEA
jgi:hypothetical protein